MTAYRLEGGDLAWVGRDIVDENTALDLGAELIVELESTRASVTLSTPYPALTHSPQTGYLRSTTLWNPFITPIARLKIQIRRPIIREIIRKLTSRAARVGRDIVCGHGDVERVTPHNLVDVWRGHLAGVDEGVDPVDDDLGAAEPEHSQAAAAAELGRALGG